MNRTDKAEFLERFSTSVAQSPLVVLLDYRGATVAESSAFRGKLKANGLHVEVVKNTLARRAISGTEKEVLSPHLVGMTSMVLSGDDPIGAARLIKSSLDAKGKLLVRGGCFEGAWLVPDGVMPGAELPGPPELLSMLLATVQAGPQQAVSVIQAPARDLMYLLKNYEGKLAEGQDAE